MTTGPEQRARPFSGYHNRPPAAEESPLTRVGPGTPCGEYLRRFWHPFLMSEELADTPKAVRLLGEDLVLFRDRGGRLGLLHRHCIHRGTSLEFGIPDAHGLRCCYHGWLFDVDGTVLETPAEPAASPIKAKFCQGAYPVREYHGLIFAYLGPPGLIPDFPLYDSFTHPPANRLVPLKLEMPCNWLQIVENACDPIHNQYLHVIVSGRQFSPIFGVDPVLDFPETPLGFLSMATRRVKDRVFVRASDIIMPNVGQFIGAGHEAERDEFQISAFLTRWAVPVDDHHSLYIGFTHFNGTNDPLGRIREESIGLGKLNLIGQTADRPYVERQREPGDYDAVVSQGAIANRRAEHLGTTDRGIVLFRRMLARAIAEIAEGREPSLPRRDPGGAVRSYTYSLVLRLPPGSTMGRGETDALGAFGRQSAGIVVATDGFDPAAREVEAERRIRALLVGEPVG